MNDPKRRKDDMAEGVIPQPSPAALEGTMPPALAQRLKKAAEGKGLTASHGADFMRRVLAKMGRPDPKIMVLGSYGVGNIGDEAILTGVLRWIQNTKPEARVCVPSRRHPDLVRSLHEVDSAPLFSAQTLWQFLTSQVLVVGGGSLFDHEMPTAAKLLPLFAILAKLLGKKVVLTSLGFYRGYPWLPTALARVAYALADGASVRDPASWEQTGWARRRRPIETVPDPSIDLEAAPPEESQNLLKAEGIDPQAFLVGLQLRYLKNEAVNRRVVAEVAKAADELAARLGAQVVFFPMDRSMTVVGSKHGDHILAEELQAAMQKPEVLHSLHREDYTPAQIKGMIGQMRLFIGMRLIPLFFSYSLGVPTVAIPYSDKVSSLLEMLGEEGVSPWQLDGGKLAQQVETTLRRHQALTEDT